MAALILAAAGDCKFAANDAARRIGPRRYCQSIDREPSGASEGVTRNQRHGHPFDHRPSGLACPIAIRPLGILPKKIIFGARSWAAP
jgi:hypothetical protein